jgi:hypothetical protein
MSCMLQTITNLAVLRNSCTDKIVRSRWVSHVTLYFHSYFFRHDGAKHQYPLLCKYIIDLVRTAIKHERSPYRGRPSKVTPSWGNARIAGGVSNGLACATRLESLMRTCWLGCRDREREREDEAVTHLQAGARRRVRSGSGARTATAGGPAAGFTPARDHVPPCARKYIRLIDQ